MTTIGTRKFMSKLAADTTLCLSDFLDVSFSARKGTRKAPITPWTAPRHPFIAINSQLPVPLVAPVPSSPFPCLFSFPCLCGLEKDRPKKGHGFQCFGVKSEGPCQKGETRRIQFSSSVQTVEIHIFREPELKLEQFLQVHARYPTYHMQSELSPRCCKEEKRTCLPSWGPSPPAHPPSTTTVGNWPPNHDEGSVLWGWDFDPHFLSATRPRMEFLTKENLPEAQNCSHCNFKGFRSLTRRTASFP